jgi:hypothetical protein
MCSDTDIATSTWVSGFVASTVFCMVVVVMWFDMLWYEAVIAIVLGMPLAVICVQCTGETDTAPTGAVGKVRRRLLSCLMLYRRSMSWRFTLPT